MPFNSWNNCYMPYHNFSNVQSSHMFIVVVHTGNVNYGMYVRRCENISECLPMSSNCNTPYQVDAV